MAQVALAWSLSKPFVTAPIVGTTSLDKLKGLVGAHLRLETRTVEIESLTLLVQRLPDGVNVKLTEEEVKAIDDLYRPRPIIGHS